MYSTRAWRKIREHWIDQQLPRCQATTCLHPGIPIDYTRPHTGPLSFSCGHIVAVHIAERLGWPAEKIWSIENTRPEHNHCNTSDGARLGNQQQRRALPPTPRVQRPASAQRW